MPGVKEGQTRKRQAPSIRSYDGTKDLAGVQRIWREVGWLDGPEQEAVLEEFLSVGRTLVSDVRGSPECAVHSVAGKMRYLKQDLELAAVTAVTTSRVARKLGLARYLTADLMARDALEGAEVSVLGIFEQGFYDLLGYGNGAYEQWVRFDPATLRTGNRFRVPQRLDNSDWEDMHKALCQRRRGHGGCILNPPELLKAETVWTSKGFGLGYRDGPGAALSHYFWASNQGQNGPVSVQSMAYRSDKELLELLALLGSLGDQVSLVELLEPAEIQLQDLLKQPFRNRRNTRRSSFENSSRCLAPWQLRILNLAACIEKVVLTGPELSFNLRLNDPVGKYLPDECAWRGCGGCYVVTLGCSSRIGAGEDPSLPILESGIGAFSRLWFGIRPASSLAITDDLSAPADLLIALDETLRLPRVHLGWDF